MLFSAESQDCPFHLRLPFTWDFKHLYWN